MRAKRETRIQPSEEMMTPVVAPMVLVAVAVATVPVTLARGVSVLGGSAGPVIAGAGAAVIHAVVAAAQSQGGRDQQKQGCDQAHRESS